MAVSVTDNRMPSPHLTPRIPLIPAAYVGPTLDEHADPFSSYYMRKVFYARTCAQGG